MGSEGRAHHFWGARRAPPHAPRTRPHSPTARAHSPPQGYNAAVIAYGQTGSGKTFTMEGDLGAARGPAGGGGGVQS